MTYFRQTGGRVEEERIRSKQRIQSKGDDCEVQTKVANLNHSESAYLFVEGI